MNYHKIETISMANGIGIRVVLWVSGCSLHCKGCHNPQTWDFNSGKLFDEQARQELFKALDKPYIDGITFSGGHPLEIKNYSTVLGLVQEIQNKHPDKTIWVYTGLNWEQVKNLEIMNYIDVLVDGDFIQEYKDITLAFRGSANQRIIDVQKSLKENKVILWEE